MTITEKAKNHYLKTAEREGKNYHFDLSEHVARVEGWALKTAENYPEADREVLSLAAWLHDIGFYLGNSEDHSINSEEEAERFLTEQSYDKTKQVMHCVRSHRCRDVLPQSVEAKILAFSDSASHMTDFIYLDIFRMWGLERVLSKLERDWRDVNRLPEGKNLEPLYQNWKGLLTNMPEWVFDMSEEQKRVMIFEQRTIVESPALKEYSGRLAKKD